MKKILYRLLFTNKERYLIENSLVCRSQSDFYQNSEDQNKKLKPAAWELFIKIYKELS
jgi:hypothetical protein